MAPTPYDVYMDGRFVPWEQANINVMTHAFSYGTGCFEGIRGYWNEAEQQVFLFRMREHYIRLQQSCNTLLIKLPHTVDELMDITIELLRRNKIKGDIYLRPFAYKNTQMIGVRLHDVSDGFLIIPQPMGNYVDIGGLKCGISSWRRIDDNMIPARAKISGAYINSAFAKSEALLNGFDEAIMLTHDGHVSEGSAENIFIISNGQLVTPSPSENILLGITRDTVIQLAEREYGKKIIERAIDRTELYGAEECFLCGTGAQIAPVISVDHRNIGTGQIGPFTRAMQQLYFQVVRGQRKEYLHLCTPVWMTVQSKP